MGQNRRSLIPRSSRPTRAALSKWRVKPSAYTGGVPAEFNSRSCLREPLSAVAMFPGATQQKDTTLASLRAAAARGSPPNYAREGLIRRAFSINSTITATASIAGAPAQSNSGAAIGAPPPLTEVWMV